MTAYDLYCYLDAAIDLHQDAILLKEDPTEQERKDYDMIKFWRPSDPDVDVKNILKSIIIPTGDNK